MCKSVDKLGFGLGLENELELELRLGLGLELGLGLRGGLCNVVASHSIINIHVICCLRERFVTLCRHISVFGVVLYQVPYSNVAL